MFKSKTEQKEVWNMYDILRNFRPVHIQYFYNSIFTCSIATYSSSKKLGGKLLAVVKTIQKCVRILDDFIMGVVGLLGYGTCCMSQLYGVTSAAWRK